MNESRTCSKSDSKLTQPRSGPVRYELIDKDGLAVEVATSPQWLANYAKHLWPDQEQDEDRTGNGWDVQVAGCDRALKPPYPFCRTPEKCAGKGYCPRDIACND